MICIFDYEPILMFVCERYIATMRLLVMPCFGIFMNVWVCFAFSRITLAFWALLHFIYNYHLISQMSVVLHNHIR
jgi:hypothetical protein